MDKEHHIQSVKPLKSVIRFVTRCHGRSASLLGPSNLHPVGSSCYWIQDGAQVQIDRFPDKPCGVSAGCFVSADGLETDLTGFSLRDSSEKQRRFSQVAKLAAGPINALASIPLKDLKSHNRKRYRRLGNTVLLLALGIGWSFPVAGIPVATMMGIFGLFSRFATRAEQDKLIEDLVGALAQLKSSWKSNGKL